jgi:YHS domain-containing protein
MRTAVEISQSREGVDPVCGRKTDSLATPIKLEYDGKINYFCQPSCLQAFIKAPGKYAAAGS